MLSLASPKKTIFAYVLLISAASFLSYQKIAIEKQQGSFYQTEFAPAALWALGHGYNQPKSWDEMPDLSQFLSGKLKTFPAKNINKIIFSVKPPNRFQEASYYLMLSAGLCWKLLGFSWENLWPVYVALYTISAVAVFHIFRAFLPYNFSLVAALLFIFSPLQLEMLPHLRDYSKAPFLLSSIAIIFSLILNKYNSKKYLLISAFLGLVVGVGCGFRMDLIIIIPLYIFVILFCLPFSLFEKTALKIGIIFLFLSSTCLFGFPLLSALSKGGNTFHVIILGLTEPFSIFLGAQNNFSFGKFYNDSYLLNLINFYQKTNYETLEILSLATKKYEALCFQYYLEICKTAPFEIFIKRPMAVMVNLIKMEIPIIKHQIILNTLAFLIILFLFVFYKKKKSLIILIAISYYFFYINSLQFNQRHFFYLQFALVGSIFYSPFAIIQILKQSKLQKNKHLITNFKNLLVLALISIFVFLFKHYEIKKIKKLFNVIENMEVNQFYVTKENNDSYILVPKKPNFPCLGMIQFERNNMERNGTANLKILYDTQDPYFDYSEEVLFNSNEQQKTVTKVFLIQEGFSNLQLNAYAYQLLGKSGTVKEFQKKTPILFFDTIKKSNIIRKWNFLNKESKQKFITSNNPKIKYQKPVLHDKNLNLIGASFYYDDVPPSKYHYFLSFGPLEVNKNTIFICEGELIEGGISVGLLKNNQWYKNVAITEPSKFSVIFQPESGNIEAMLAHNVEPIGKCKFTILRAEWLDIGKE